MSEQRRKTDTQTHTFLCETQDTTRTPARANLVLVPRWGAKSGKDGEEHKEVVDAEKLFEEVRRDPDQGRPAPAREKHIRGEDEGEPNPHRRPPKRVGQAHGAACAQQHVDSEHDDDKHVERRPEHALLLNTQVIQQVRLERPKVQLHRGGGSASMCVSVCVRVCVCACVCM